MKIFLSYPHEWQAEVERVCFGLEAEGHDVFFDKTDLPHDRSFNSSLRAQIDACDLFVFMITPQSVERGRYSLSELGLAQRRWRNPNDGVVAVMLEVTPIE